MLLPMQEINRHTQQYHPDPDRRRPIRITRADGDRDGETAEDDDESRIEECEGVDGEAPSAEAPAGVG